MAAQPIHVDISEELQDWQNARHGREVRSANVRALTKLQNQTNSCVDFINQKGNEIEDIKQDAIQAAGQAAAAAENANQALENVEEVRQDLADRVAAGEFDGAPGAQGPQGPQGESGVMAPSAGMFSLYLDPATGNLYADYPDGETPPAFEYDSDSGNLYYVTG